MLLATFSLLLSVTSGSAALSEAPRPSSRVLTACTVVTQADVEQALGRRVGKGTESESSCDFQSTNGLVTITVHRLSRDLDLDAEAGALKTAMPQARLRETSALGTRAFFLDLPNAGTQLHVIQQGRLYVMVSVLGFGEAAQVSQAAESIARRAITRLLPL